jgi:hypothetical protein
MKTSALKALLAAIVIPFCVYARGGEADTWGAWSDLDGATYTHSDYCIAGSPQTFHTTLQIRQSSTSPTLYQIKVPSAFGGSDLLLTWHKDINLSTNTVEGEAIALNYALDEYDDMEFQSVIISPGTYAPAQGVMTFKVCYSLNAVGAAVYGYTATDKIVFDNVPTYTFTATPSKTCYAPTDSRAEVSFTHSDNIRSVRYYAEPAATADFSATYKPLNESEFIAKPYTTVDADGTAEFNMQGYQPYRVYFQTVSADSVATDYTSATVYSTQPDGREWTAAGTGTLYDSAVGKMTGNDGCASWHVDVQQCADDASLYRLVNPYTTDACPYEVSRDTSHDYYIYFRVNSLNSGSEVISYTYPTGLTVNGKPCIVDALSTVADNYLISNADGSVKFAFAQYIDYSFTLRANGNAVTIVPTADAATYVYQITSADGTYTSAAERVGSDLTIALPSDDLLLPGDYLLTVCAQSADGETKAVQTHNVTAGVTDWQYVGEGVATYTVYMSGSERLKLYKRTATANPQHEQYQVRGWLYGVSDLLIDVADINTYDANNHVVVTVPTNTTKYVYGAHGNICISDTYTYSENDNYYNDSYFIPSLGEFHLKNVYYVENGYIGFAYETFKIDAYPELELVDNGKKPVDGINTQSVTVSMNNVAYVKYGVFDAGYYTAGIALAELERRDNADTLTETTTLTFNETGDYLLVAASYDADGNVLETKSITFRVRPAINLDDWTYIGKSTFTDGWIAPLYTVDGQAINAAEHPWNVDTYVSNANPNIIGLLNPYNAAGCVLQGYNADTTNDFMLTIDLSADDFVSVPEQESGFVDATYGMVKVYNVEGYYSSRLTDTEYIKRLIGESHELSTCAADGDNATLITIACGMYSVRESAYYSAQKTYIRLPRTLSAVNAVESPDTDAPTEYYNLQGVRVNNPAHGIFIRRQGQSANVVRKF